MNDANFLRKDADAARRGFKSRNEKLASQFDEWLKLDAEYREALKGVEDLRAKRNASSQEIGKAKASKNEAEAQRLMTEVAGLKEKMAMLENLLAPLAEKVRLLSLNLPHLPHESTPVGASEADNPEVRIGRPPVKFDFKPLDHQTLGEKLGILDFAAAAKLSGSRFALWKGKGAKLMRAIVAFQLELHISHGYQEILPPYLVRPEILEGTGQLPKFEADLYKTKNSDGEKANDLYLIPTAEVPLTNLVRDEILSADKLPMKLTAYSPCFRQEAGSYGKDVKGLIRNHQFDKVELVWITQPEESLAALETLTKDAERVLETLELPHRVIALCTADIGFSSRKTYDLEIWMPSESRYREISSCSDCGDFQARRMNARFRKESKAPAELVHTLNGSGVAVGRLFAALLENGQQKDGSVLIPKALQPFCGFDKISVKKSALEDLVGLVARLRAPNGCPWDREQTHVSLLRYLREESAEVEQAIKGGTWHEIEDELGDLLLQVLLHSEIAREKGQFDIEDVARSQYLKLKRRHPHVFGDKKFRTAKDVKINWKTVKDFERDLRARDIARRIKKRKASVA